MSANEFASNMGVNDSSRTSRYNVFVPLQNVGWRERTAERLCYLEDFADFACRIASECFEPTG